MIGNRGRITMKPSEFIIIEPQCLSCTNCKKSLDCEVGFVPDENIFLNKITCLEYEKITHNYS